MLNTETSFTLSFGWTTKLRSVRWRRLAVAMPWDFRILANTSLSPFTYGTTTIPLWLPLVFFCFLCFVLQWFLRDILFAPVDGPGRVATIIERFSNVLTERRSNWSIVSLARTARAHTLKRQAGSSVWGSRNTRKKWTLSQLVHRPEPPGQGRAV